MLTFNVPGGKFFGFLDNWNIKTMDRANKQISTIMLTANARLFCFDSPFRSDYVESDVIKKFSNGSK